MKPAPPAETGKLTADAYNATGRKLIQEGSYQKAVDALSEALTLDPKHVQALNARGYAYMFLRQYSKALADLNFAIDLKPEYANAYLTRAGVKGRMGDQKGADEDRAKAASLKR